MHAHVSFQSGSTDEGRTRAQVHVHRALLMAYYIQRDLLMVYIGSLGYRVYVHRVHVHMISVDRSY
jgi:hypothetical protein